ncbi:MAG TPA: gluconate 2-dehydrogenase subunit 3 family protein [Bryobacteraceae bacterium]|nr:gluconate 2-dehydrogenase subunit 3 family protein [Bryobacteraceae bacterium]
MLRRELTGLIAAGVLRSRLSAAQHGLHQLRKAPQEYTIQVFTPEEHRLIDVVSELIIPAAEASPGASAARVADYIDLVVANSSQASRSNWKRRLAAWDDLARQRFGRAFPELEPNSQAAMINELANSQSDAGRLFADMKRMTLAGYYTSEIGLRQELGFRGGVPVAGFPGCRHDPASHR